MHETHVTLPPSNWVRRHAGLVAPGGEVLDLAAGSGRHTLLFHDLGHPVLAIDRDVTGLAARTAGQPPLPGIEILHADLEDGSPWPAGNRRFAGIVVTNYLHRPLLADMLDALLPGGILIYETFALGNERFGKPANPAFLLEPGELLRLAGDHDLTVLGYFCGEVRNPRPAVIQSIAARAPC